MEGIVLHRDDDAAQPAGGSDAVPALQRTQNLLPLFLLRLLRTDEQQIEDSEHENEGQKEAEPGRAGGLKNRGRQRKVEHRTQHSGDGVQSFCLTFLCSLNWPRSMRQKPSY